MGDMTQEREAMERLLQREKGASGEDVYGLSGAAKVMNAEFADRNAIIESVLSRHARSKEPITVEGLKECGFCSTYYLGQWQRDNVIVQWLAMGCMRVDIDGHPCHPQPTNMAQIDDLLSR